MNDDFYVGYFPKMSASMGKWIGRIVVGLLAGALGISALLMLGQVPFDASRFEYGVIRDYTGEIEEWPYPILKAGRTSLLLVGPGKHGLSQLVKGLQGEIVQLKGALIERGKDRMLEVLPASIHVTEQAAAPTKTVALGPVTLRGEIVDSKCYLGVMNPGSGKVHRDCAARCISGGAPPAFVARDESGQEEILLLVGSDGRQLSKEVLAFVAEPVEISGVLVSSGSSLVLKAEPAQFRRYAE